MRRMLCSACACVLLAVGPAMGQEDARPNSLAAGSWALMFSVTDNFTIAPFQGGGISLKRQFSERSAVRAGIDVALDSQESNRDLSVTQTLTSDNYGFELEGLYQRYTSPGKTINFYWGAGAYGGYSDGSREARADSTLNRDDTSSYNLGAVGALGVEFFAARSISLLAEYRGTVGYHWNEVVSVRQRPGVPDQQDTRDSSGWSVGTGTVRLGLSAYF